jgi:hypothetical protein
MTTELPVPRGVDFDVARCAGILVVACALAMASYHRKIA